MEQGVNLFPGDAYDTPEDVRRSRRDRVLLGGRWYFFFRNFQIFSNSGRCARRGGLDAERQIYYSNQNIRLIESCGGKIHLRGLDNLRHLDGAPAVLIGNHMSLLETAVLHAIVRPHLDFTFVIKTELMRIPHFRDIMRAIGAIEVGRENPREDLKYVLTEGKKTLEAGRSIIIFPQSTRSQEFDPTKFNTIGVKLARAAGVPVVPFALKTDFIGNGRLIRNLGPIRRENEIWFEFTPAMKIAGSGKEEQQKIVDFIGTKLAEWRGQA